MITVICQRCFKANASGQIWALCDHCQDEWFDELERREPNADGKIAITDAEALYAHREFIKSELLHAIATIRQGRIGQ